MTTQRSYRYLHDDLVPSAVDALRGVLQRVQTIDLRAAESDKSEAAHESLLRTILPLLDEASAIIGRVAARFEESRDDDRMEALADIAAIAGMALQERRGFLTHPRPCDHWTFLETCEHSLRTLGKSSSVVDGALARYGGLPARIDRSAALANALRIRRRYGTLRLDVGRLFAQGPLHPRLQAVSRSAFALLSCDAFPSMRLGDRRELRMLQFRIQSWLSTEHASEAAGEHLWEEATAVISLLGGINQRSELVTHDTEILAGIAGKATILRDLRALRDAAAPLFGLDAELDVLLNIHGPEGREHGQWQRTIARVAAERGIACAADEEPERSACSLRT